MKFFLMFIATVIADQQTLNRIAFYKDVKSSCNSTEVQKLIDAVILDLENLNS